LGNTRKVATPKPRVPASSNNTTEHCAQYWRVGLVNISAVEVKVSSDYRTPNSSPPKPATWISPSGKPLKYKCNLITLTEMGDSTSANPGNHCYSNSRKRDGHRIQ
jgi:hypothetical protein